MPGSFSIRLTRDDVTKDLKKKLGKVQNPQKLLRAIGSGLVGLAIKSFTDASLRPSPWPPLKDGRPARLYRSGTLKHSIKLVSVTGKNVMIGSPMPYAAVHQLGSEKKGIPPRPYFPFKDKQLTKQGAERVDAIVKAFMEQ